MASSSRKSRHSASPHTQRSERRRPDERGLPDDTAVLAMAETYLELQRRLWPELIGNGILPSKSDKGAAGLLTVEFKRRFLDVASAPELYQTVSSAWQVLGLVYLRFSDANSNPRSLAQQLRNVLERARRDQAFIPWCWIFADAAVSGTTSARRGYEMAKAQIAATSTGRHLYLDELGRAARDAIEALMLGRLVENAGKRMIGVSDGFDSDLPQSKLMLGVYASLHQWFSEQLRSKVERGMTDAFLAGRNISLPALGYTLIPIIGPSGQPLLGANGRPFKKKAVDEEEAVHVRNAFHLFAEKLWSPDRIAKEFCRLSVGGSAAWDRSSIEQLLKRTTYIGIEHSRTRRKVRDPVTNKIKVIQRPKEEWLRRDDESLRIVSNELWEKAQKRLAACSEAFSKRKRTGKDARTAVYPTTLFRPICGYCGKALWFGRGGRYPVFCCPNGSRGKHGCQLTSYKSIRILDEIVLAYLAEKIFTEDYLELLVAKANEFLALEVQRPPKNANPIQKDLRKVKAARDRLARAIETGGGQDVGTLVKLLQGHERRIRQLTDELTEVNVSNAPPPPPLEIGDVKDLLGDLRQLLAEDVASAAPVLAELVGPIRVTHAGPKTKNRMPWQAEFTVNAMPALVEIARRRNCPITRTLEYLLARGWTMQQSAKLTIQYVPVRERILPMAKELKSRGCSTSVIAGAVGAAWSDVRAGLVLADPTKAVVDLPAIRRLGRYASGFKYVRHAADVYRLRHEEKLPFGVIAKSLGMHPSTVTRAYDFANRTALEYAAANGMRPRRGRLGHI